MESKYNIEYLIFEGGGGKGTVYLSVIKALNDAKLLPISNKKIKGIAGSSAGSINALATALGYTFEELWQLIFEDKVFDSFLPKLSEQEKFNETVFSDKSFFGNNTILNDGFTEQRCVIQDNEPPFRTYGGTISLPIFYEKELKDTVKQIADKYPAVKNISSIIHSLNSDFPSLKTLLNYDFSGSKVSDLINAYSLSKLINSGGLFGGQRVNKTLFEKIIVKKTLNISEISKYETKFKSYKYKWYFKSYDFAFTKTTPTNAPLNNPYLDSYYNSLPPLSSKEDSYDINPKSFDDFQKNLKSRSEGELTLFDNASSFLTFSKFKEHFGVDLVVTGSNISQGKLFYFSNFDTPDFPVVDAIAISMNIPFLWSPVFVKYTSPKGIQYDGFFVDGGLFNNFPLRVFNEPTNQPVMSKSLNNSNLNSKTIGFVIDRIAENYINTIAPGFGDVLGATIDSVLDKSTSNSILKREELEQVAFLESAEYGVDTYNFGPDKNKFATLNSASYKSDTNYKIANKIIQNFKSR